MLKIIISVILSFIIICWLIRRKNNSLKYNVKKLINKEKKEYLGISGFNFNLSARDILLMQDLLNRFIGKSEIAVIITKQEETIINNGVYFSLQMSLQQGMVYLLEDGWCFYFGEPQGAPFLEIMSKFWHLQQGNDAGVSFFGCSIEDVHQIALGSYNLIKKMHNKFVTSERIVIDSNLDKLKSVLFNVGADGDILYVYPCNKKSIEEIYSIINSCINKI